MDPSTAAPSPATPWDVGDAQARDERLLEAIGAAIDAKLSQHTARLEGQLDRLRTELCRMVERKHAEQLFKLSKQYVVHWINNCQCFAKIYSR